MSVALDTLITRRRAAEILSLREQTLSKWAMSGKNLKPVKLPDTRTVRYRLSDVMAIVGSGQSAE
jgi:hypothetical protein